MASGNNMESDQKILEILSDLKYHRDTLRKNCMSPQEQVNRINKLAAKNPWKPGEAEAETRRLNELAKRPESQARLIKYLRDSGQIKD